MIVLLVVLVIASVLNLIFSYTALVALKALMENELIKRRSQK